MKRLLNEDVEEQTQQNGAVLNFGKCRVPSKVEPNNIIILLTIKFGVQLDMPMQSKLRRI